MSTVNVNIEGMTCGSCTYKVECEVGDLSGVTDAKCDLANKSGTFNLEAGAATTAEDIVNKINSLGFKASLKV